MNKNRRIEFGDFQTPAALAIDVCKRLAELGLSPDTVVEPTCGIGAFVLAACAVFRSATEILGFEINRAYLDRLRAEPAVLSMNGRVRLEQADFFAKDWRSAIGDRQGSILVLGNFPWVTNSVQSNIGGTNLPAKTNFQGRPGFDAISGKANFDISEWMLLEVLRWFEGRTGDIAMLVKTSVARKVLAEAQRQRAAVRDALMIGIDAKKQFNASVEACLLVIRLGGKAEEARHDYRVYADLHDRVGRRVGHREGHTVCDLDAFEVGSHLLGQSPQKWRSGVKHDASAVMEFTRTERGLENGLGEVVEIEDEYLFPLLKGSDIGSNKDWRSKYMLVTQRRVGEPTASIEEKAPKTWEYLVKHAAQLDARGSTIYAKSPRFSIFGVGDYAFRPWKIAICGLYKTLKFRLVGPISERPVMFDDTVYFISFDTEAEARSTLAKLDSSASRDLLTSLIFWDEKRPIKTGILNALDWSRIDGLVVVGTSETDQPSSAPISSEQPGCGMVGE